MEELRQLISYVPQENYLFNGTIKENIQFSKTNATDEEVKNAAIAANAHDFIVELEDGYDTIVGERGNMLSGGQRQRVAIARALLKNAPILLLDEATASLDSEAEREVQLAIDRLMQDRSTIIIAHRLATIENADKIIVLEDGNIQEAGSHNDLLIQNNRYAYYYNIQFKIPNGEIE
jgi:ABC-type multidrug transport system fused ATPase/permease subunit